MRLHNTDTCDQDNHRWFITYEKSLIKPCQAHTVFINIHFFLSLNHIYIWLIWANFSEEYYIFICASQKHYRLALYGEKNAYVFRTGFKNQFIDFLKLLVTGHKGQQNAELWMLAKLGNLVGQCRSKKTHVSWRVVTIATSIQRRVSAESTPNVYHQRKALYPKEIWPMLTTSMPEVNK